VHGAFFNSIFMIGTRATIPDTLFAFANVSNKCVSFEGATAGEVSIHHHSILKCHGFEGLFCTDRFNSREAKLEFNKEETRRVIDKDASAFVGGRGGLSEGVKGASQKKRFKMIHFLAAGDQL
jgi:hypothetical protein